jgi:hypothetical protein
MTELEQEQQRERDEQEKKRVADMLKKNQARVNEIH